MRNLSLIIHSAIYAVFAIVLFFIPDLLWPFYGVEVNDQYARFLSQHNSIFLGGVAIIAFLCRNAATRELITGLLFTNILGVVVDALRLHQRSICRIRLVGSSFFCADGRAMHLAVNEICHWRHSHPLSRH